MSSIWLLNQGARGSDTSLEPDLLCFKLQAPTVLHKAQRDGDAAARTVCEPGRLTAQIMQNLSVCLTFLEPEPTVSNLETFEQQS